MRRPEEEHPVRRHEDGTQVFDALVLDAVAVDQGPFDDQSAQRVADEDDGTVRTASKLYAVSSPMGRAGKGTENSHFGWLPEKK